MCEAVGGLESRGDVESSHVLSQIDTRRLFIFCPLFFFLGVLCHAKKLYSTQDAKVFLFCYEHDWKTFLPFAMTRSLVLVMI